MCLSFHVHVHVCAHVRAHVLVHLSLPAADTLVNRIGSLLGAGYFSLCLRFAVSPPARRAFLLLVTLVWATTSLAMGRLSRVRGPDPMPPPETPP